MLLIFQISSYVTGYDGSMMKMLQSLDNWKDSFNNPGTSELGLQAGLDSIPHIVVFLTQTAVRTLSKMLAKLSLCHSVPLPVTNLVVELL